MSLTYEEFLERKALVAASADSSACASVPLNPKLKEHQTILTGWGLRRQRAAVFASTGLGKGWIILEYGRVVSLHTKKPFLILAPLAVSQQFAREAEKLGTGITICSGDADVRPGINVCNYQKLHRFDVQQFGGVAADESSLIKHQDGHYRKLLIESFRSTPFRLSATATPSPNDFTELGGQAEFLGVCTHQEMLSMFFVHDGGSTQDWRLKGHAKEAFWRWVCSWGAIVKMPSDVGGDDSGYDLPPLKYHEHIIPASQEDAHKAGLLVAAPAETLIEQRAARRGTLDTRVAKAAEIANATNESVLVFCDLNTESAALTKAIRGAVEVAGWQDDDVKEASIDRFLTGAARVCISKSSLMGFGLNLQFCRTVIFCGVSHSFEQFFQAIRRCWRFGQTLPVDVHIISSELEGRVVENLKEKQRKADELSEETRRYVAAYVKGEVTASKRDTIAYNPTKKFKWPSWMRTEES